MLEIKLSVAGETNQPIPLVKSIYTLGRIADIKIPQLALEESEYRKISRIHCTLIWVHPTYLVVDGNNQGKHSENGIIVNGRRCRASMLKGGDLVSLSKEVYFEFIFDEIIEFKNLDETQGSDDEL